MQDRTTVNVERDVLAFIKIMAAMDDVKLSDEIRRIVLCEAKRRGIADISLKY